jgi:hypothetical protein
MLQRSVPNVLSMFWIYCCKCVYLDVVYVFTYMLQVFYLNIAYVCNSFQVFFICFCKCFRAYFKCFNCLQLLLQVLCLDASRVDRVLHKLQCAWEVEGTRAVPARGLAAWTASGQHGPVWARETQAQAEPCIFFTSVGVGCWCEHGKLQHRRLDAGLGPNVWAQVVIVDNTTCVQLSSARTNFVQTVEVTYKS